MFPAKLPLHFIPDQEIYMAKQVNNGSVLKCSFGAAPSTMMVTPENLVNALNQPAATIFDHVPVKNIMPFGMCSAPTNPAVIAAQGSPVPCIPATTSPWVPGAPTVMIKNKPALNDSSQCLCTWLGVIKVQMSSAQTVNIP